MTGFQSANLKELYEEARDLGIPLMAAELASLFSYSELEHIIDVARDVLRRIDTVTETIESWEEVQSHWPVASRKWYQYERMLEPMREVLAELQDRWSSGELWD